MGAEKGCQKTQKRCRRFLWFTPLALPASALPGILEWQRKILISFVGMKKMLAKHFISAQAFAHQIEYLIAKGVNGGKLAFLRTFPFEKNMQ